jgi:hypothetical protein
MWNLRLAESVGDGAVDAVVVALDMSTRQAQRRKKVEYKCAKRNSTLKNRFFS